MILAPVKKPIRVAGQRILLFAGAGEGGYDKAAKGSTGLGIGGRITTDAGSVLVETVLPVGALCGIGEDNLGLCNSSREGVYGMLTGRCRRSYIRIADNIGVRLTVAGTENDLVGAGEFARHGVEGMREGCSCHKLLGVMMFRLQRYGKSTT